MITVVRTVVAMPGKLGELTPVAKEICGIIKRLCGKDVAAGNAIGGNGVEVAWIAQYDSLGQWEEVTLKLMADADYRGLLKKIETLYVPGSVHDHIWRHA